MIGCRALLRRLRRSVSGLATTELALGLPFLLGAGLWGVELANYGVTMMRVNQLAVHMADNASRIGDTSMLANRKIYEADIMDLLKGAHIQGGKQIEFFEYGRVIISSLQVNEDEDQYIHWQRCLGRKVWNSSYGAVDDVLASGMGPDGRQVIAFDDEAVMFVEVAYDYQPLISGRFIGTPEIKSVASFTVRSDRDLSGIFQRDSGDPDPVADCSDYSNPFGTFGGGSGGGGGSSSTSSSSSSGGGSSSSGGGSSSSTSSTSGGSTSTTSSTSGGSTSSTSGGSTSTTSSTSGGSTSSTSTTSGGSTSTTSSTSGGSTSTTSSTSGGSTSTTSSSSSTSGGWGGSGGSSGWGGSSSTGGRGGSSSSSSAGGRGGGRGGGR